jgi:hypothetical protein
VYAKTFWLLLGLSIFSASVYSMSDEDYRYLIGYQSYLEKNYLDCAIQMESLKDSMVMFTSEGKNKIIFYRAYCNGQLGYHEYALSLLKELNKRDASNKESNRFIMLQKSLEEEILKTAHAAYLDKNFEGCAYKLESLKDSMDIFSTSVQSKTLLYRAYCNSKLGYGSYAAALIEDIDISHLDDKEYRILVALEEYIKVNINERNNIYTWITFYGGAVSYSPVDTKLKANLYGVSASFMPGRGNWDIGMGAEQMNLTLANNLNSYSQTQANFSFGKNLGKLFALHGFFTNITASNSGTSTAGNQGRVLGIFSSYNFSNATKFNFEYDYSLYPSLSLGKTTVHQYVISWDQTLLTTTSYTLRSKLLSQTVMPRAQITIEPTSGLILKSSYQRVALDLNIYFTNIQIGLSGWGGKEIFGARNQGNLVLNAVEEHSGGYGINTQIDLSKRAAVKFAYSQDFFNTNGPNITANIFVGGVTITF